MSRRAITAPDAATIRSATWSEIHYLPSSELSGGCARHGNAQGAICDRPCRESGWSFLRKLAGERGQ